MQLVEGGWWCLSSRGGALVLHVVRLPMLAKPQNSLVAFYTDSLFVVLTLAVPPKFGSILWCSLMGRYC